MVDASFFSQIADVAVALVAVLGFIVVAAMLAKKIQERIPGHEHIKVLHVAQVGTRERVVLIEFASQRLLLGVTAGGISRLDNHEAEIEEIDDV